ncbi:MAG: SDR family NAD(P)-dependent oxidoreductase [Streptosporangiaceae bacterium]
MTRYQATVRSHRSAAETFSYLATFSNAAQWDPGVLTGEQLDPGPITLGTRFRLVVPFLGFRLALTYHVTRYQPGSAVVLAATTGILRASDRITVTADAHGSTVSYEADVRLRGPLRLLDVVLRPSFRAVADRAAAGLAQALSGEPGPDTAPAPPGTSIGSPRGRQYSRGCVVTGFGTAVDAALEVLVGPGFSRIGLAARSALLPEFTVQNSHRLDGKTVIVTGATSGIGYSAAVGLARRGAAVHFLARDRGRAERARRCIAAASGSATISYGLADLEQLNSVREFARQFHDGHARLDVLIHNAGTIHSEFSTDRAGIELTVAGQVVAPFLLTSLLIPALVKAAPSRVITVSSGGMYTKRLDPAILRASASTHRGATAYAKAKRAQVALSREWASRLAGTGVAFHAMHPGWVDTPGIAEALPGFRRLTRSMLLTPDQGADTIVWLATMPPERLGNGRFWHDRRQRPEHLLPWTYDKDQAAARDLWDRLAAFTAPASEPA